MPMRSPRGTSAGSGWPTAAMEQARSPTLPRSAMRRAAATAVGEVCQVVITARSGPAVGVAGGVRVALGAAGFGGRVGTGVRAEDDGAGSECCGTGAGGLGVGFGERCSDVDGLGACFDGRWTGAEGLGVGLEGRWTGAEGLGVGFAGGWTGFEGVGAGAEECGRFVAGRAGSGRAGDPEGAGTVERAEVPGPGGRAGTGVGAAPVPGGRTPVPSVAGGRGPGSLPGAAEPVAGRSPGTAGSVAGPGIPGPVRVAAPPLGGAG